MNNIINNFVIFLSSLLFFSNTALAALAYDSTLLMGSQSSNYWGFDLNRDRVFSEDERISIEAGIDGGIILGVTQGIGAIDSSWVFNGGVGYHYTRSPISIKSDDYSGNVILDMSGFTIWWNDESIPLNLYNDVEGILTCGNACENGDSFILEAISSIPSSHCTPSLCADKDDYLFHIEGTISVIPVPAAIWLFSSGLIGLVGFTRFKSRINKIT